MTTYTSKKGTDKIRNIVDPDFLIAFEDVRAYTIEDGVLVSILDHENRLIGENVIDSVSDEFAADFDGLVRIQEGME